MQKLLIATHNKGKFAEFFANLSDMGAELVSLNELGITRQAPEDEPTYEQNSLQKARFYHTISGLPTLADDGGFELDFLHGEPGVRSRRWNGREMTDGEMIAMVQEKMADVPPDQRGCQFRTVVTLVTSVGERSTQAVVRGEYRTPCEQRIAGYPFRSVVYLPAFGRYFVQLSDAEQRSISHRSKALQELKPYIRSYFSNQHV